MSGVKMIFTHDTDLTLMHAAALANTGTALGDEDREELSDLAALLGWMDRWEWTGRRPSTRAEVDAVRALRPRLREIWGRDEAGLVDAANTLLEEGGALPRLVRHGAFGWHVHATSDDAPLAQRIAVEVGMALIDVIRAGETERLTVCAGDHLAPSRHVRGSGATGIRPGRPYEVRCERPRRLPRALPARVHTPGSGLYPRVAVPWRRHSGGTTPLRKKDPSPQRSAGGEHPGADGQRPHTASHRAAVRAKRELS